MVTWYRPEKRFQKCVAMAMKKIQVTPLYYRLSEMLRRQISSGQLKPGDRLASERDLSIQYGMSRMTIRQALGQLEREGLLNVKSGVGTFVAEPKLTYDAVNLLGFTETMKGKKGVLSSKVLSQKLVTASTQIGQALKLGNHEIIEIKRIRLIDNIPMAIETNYLSAQRFAGLETMNLKEASLYRILDDLYNVRLRVAEQTIEASTANAFEQKHLKLKKQDSILRIEGISFDQYHQPVEFFKASFRGDRFKVSVISQPQPTKTTQTHFSLVLS